MRLSWFVLLLAFVARATSGGVPLCVSAGLGGADSDADRTLILVTNISLMSADIEADVMRAELCLGAWWLQKKRVSSHSISVASASLRDGSDNDWKGHAFYQAAKASWRTRTPPDHSPLFELGLGFGLHEEWQEDAPLDFVPRVHVSTRFCFFPSRAASSYVELEALPRVSRAGFKDIGALFWAKLGYAFRV